MDEIAVLIPCYNEEHTIQKVVSDFHAVFPEAVIYVYDNNCTDATAELARAAGAVVVPEYMQGKGNVVRRMFQDIDAKCYILVDGDDTYPAEAASSMAEKVLRHKADMVVGDRLSSTYFTENKRRFHNLGNRLVRSLINRIFQSDIRDILTGYRAFSYRFVKTFPVTARGFEIETEMTIHAITNNLQIENVIVEYRNRPASSVSKLHTVSDGIKVIGMLFNLFRNYRPLAFFSLFAAILALAAIGLFIPLVWIPFRETGLVERLPTLIVCGFMFLAALLSVFGGLILDKIRVQERREFEFRLMLIESFAQNSPPVREKQAGTAIK